MQQHELLERERSIMKQTIDSLQEELSSQMLKGRSDFESNIASMKQHQEAWDQQLVVLTRQRDERADDSRLYSPVLTKSHEKIICRQEQETKTAQSRGRIHNWHAYVRSLLHPHPPTIKKRD